MRHANPPQAKIPDKSPAETALLSPKAFQLVPVSDSQYPLTIMGTSHDREANLIKRSLSAIR
jgi:hypothetical protein